MGNLFDELEQKTDMFVINVDFDDARKTMNSEIKSIQNVNVNLKAKLLDMQCRSGIYGSSRTKGWKLWRKVEKFQLSRDG